MTEIEVGIWVQKSEMLSKCNESKINADNGFGLDRRLPFVWIIKFF